MTHDRDRPTARAARRPWVAPGAVTLGAVVLVAGVTVVSRIGSGVAVAPVVDVGAGVRPRPPAYAPGTLTRLPAADDASDAGAGAGRGGDASSGSGEAGDLTLVSTPVAAPVRVVVTTSTVAPPATTWRGTAGSEDNGGSGGGGTATDTNGGAGRDGGAGGPTPPADS